MIETQYVDGVQFPDGAVGALLAGGGEIVIRKLVPVVALVSADVEGVKDGKGEARETIHVHFLGSKSGGCADGVVVCALNVRDLNITVILLFVADHGEHKGHGVVDALDTAAGARVGRSWWQIY